MRCARVADADGRLEGRGDGERRGETSESVGERESAGDLEKLKEDELRLLAEKEDPCRNRVF